MVVYTSTSSAHPPPAPTHNLLEYIYNALGAKQAREREAHARWKAAHAAAAAGPSRQPSASTSALSASPSSSTSSAPAESSKSASIDNYTYTFQNNTRKWTNHTVNQTSVAVCNANYGSLNNALGQDPCYVARQLLDICTFGQPNNKYPLTPFTDGQRSYPSLLAQQATTCACTTQAYNLVAGCASCQLNMQDQTAMGWRTWSKNCSSIPDGGLPDWPFPVPNWTTIPDWANANVTDQEYAFNLQAAFAVSQNKSIDDFSSILSTATSTATVASSTPTPNADQNGGGMTDAQKHHQRRVTFISIIAGTVVTTLAVTAILAALTWWIVRKRRIARQGVRLASSSDLTDKDEGFRQGGAAFAQREMSQKDGNVRSHVSQFMGTESSFVDSSRRESTISFGTNSVSSRSYTDSEFTDDASLISMEEDDIDGNSISPFSNAHRAPSVRTSISLTPPGQARYASRNNLHNRDSATTWITTETGRLVPASRRAQSHLAPDARSLLSMAPSSTGATWGREHEEEDEDEGSSDGDDDYERRYQARDSTITLS